MKIAAMLSLFLTLLLAGIPLACLPPQQDASRSADLEEASKLSRQVPPLFAEKKFEEALVPAKHVLEIRERVLGPDHESVASALDIIADIYVAQEKHGAAEPLYKRALTILEKKWGLENKYLTSTIESLALVRFALHDNGGAEKLYLRSLAIKEKALAPDDPGTGNTLGTIGVFYERIEKPAKAVEFFMRSLAIKEKELGPTHPGLIEPLYGCVCALIAANKASEAKEYQMRAENIGQSLAPVQRGGAALQGIAIFKAEPQYPPEAKRAGLSGSVVIEVKVDECGRVIEARGVKGPPQFFEAAVKAARHWRFSATRVGARRVKVIGTLTFNFRI